MLIFCIFFCILPIIPSQITTRVVDLKEPIITWPDYDDLSSIVNNTAVTIKSDHGTLEVTVFVSFLSANFSGIFNVYDSDGVNGQPKATINATNSLIYWKTYTASNKAMTILFVGKDFYPQDGRFTFVARIVEDHSKNCASPDNLVIIDSNQDMRKVFTNSMSATSSGSCSFSYYVPWYDGMNFTKINFTNQDPSSKNFTILVQGYSLAKAGQLMDIWENLNSAYKGFILEQGLYSFILPANSSIEVSQNQILGKNYDFTDSLNGVIFEQTGHNSLANYEHTYTCQDCIASFSLTFFYANFSTPIIMDFGDKQVYVYTMNNISATIKANGTYFSIRYVDYPLYNTKDRYGIGINFFANSIRTNPPQTSPSTALATSQKSPDLGSTGSTPTPSLPKTTPSKSSTLNLSYLNSILIFLLVILYN